MAISTARQAMQLQAHTLARPSRSLLALPATTARSLQRQPCAIRVVSGDEPPELTGKPVRRVRPAQPENVQQKQQPPPQHQPKNRSNQQEQRYLHPRRQSGTQLNTNHDATPTQSIKGQRSIAGVVQLVQQYASDGSLDSYSLGAGLDCTVWLAKRANSPERGGDAAWVVLRPLSMGLLHELDAWALVRLLRAAAHFASLNADELKAWQAALKTQALERLPAVAVSNALLSLSTLAAGSEALKAAVDASLVVRLVQRWLQLLPGMLSIDTCQGLYGAVCLGYPFSQQELDRITQQALEVDGRFQTLNGVQLFRVWRLLDAAWGEWDIDRQLSVVAAASKRQPWAVWPGDEAVKEALRRALSMELDAKHASQILLALGQLRFQPSAAAIDALVNAYYRFLERQELTAMDLNAFLDGCALLRCRLPPKAVESCLEAVVAACASDPSDAPRCISTAAWALANLQQCDIKAWQQLAGLAAAVPIGAHWPAVSLCRLYQAYMHVRAAHGQAVQLPAQFLRAASAAFQAISTQGTTSAFHRRVARELEAACPGEAVEVDQRVGPGGRSGEAASDCWEEGWLQVNLAVPSLRLVVQADGPYQYFRNQPGVLLPTTVARDRLLRSWGWHVISVPFHHPRAAPG